MFGQCAGPFQFFILYGFLQMHLPIKIFLFSNILLNEVCSPLGIIFSGQQSDLFFPHVEFSANVGILNLPVINLNHLIYSISVSLR